MITGTKNYVVLLVLCVFFASACAPQKRAPAPPTVAAKKIATPDTTPKTIGTKDKENNNNGGDLADKGPDQVGTPEALADTESASTPPQKPFLSFSDMVKSMVSGSKIGEDQAKSIVEKVKSSGKGMGIVAVGRAGGWSAHLCSNVTTIRPVITSKNDAGELENHQDYDVVFENSGLSVELCYRWVFFFIESAEALGDVDTAIFGNGPIFHKHGTGVSIPFGWWPVGVEISWMPGTNIHANIAAFAIKAGWAAGITLPRMTFARIKH